MSALPQQSYATEEGNRRRAVALGGKQRNERKKGPEAQRPEARDQQEKPTRRQRHLWRQQERDGRGVVQATAAIEGARQRASSASAAGKGETKTWLLPESPEQPQAQQARRRRRPQGRHCATAWLRLPHGAPRERARGSESEETTREREGGEKKKESVCLTWQPNERSLLLPLPALGSA